MLLECLGDSPEMRIIDFLIENRLFDYSKKQMIEGTQMGKATFYPHFENLERHGIAKITRKFGKAKLYKLNEQNPAVKQLMKMELALIEGSAPKKIAIREVASHHKQGPKYKVNH